MKANLNQPLLSWKGIPVTRNTVCRDKGGFPIFLLDADGKKRVDENGGELLKTELEVLTIKEFLSDTLDIVEKDDTSETKNKIGEIQRKIWANDEVTFTADQVSFILTRLGKYATPVGLLRVTELLDPEAAKEKKS